MNEHSVEELAAKVLWEGYGAAERVADNGARCFMDGGKLVIRGEDGEDEGAASRCSAALAAAQLKGAEEPILLAYTFGELRDARRVVAYAGLCGIREEVARFALAKLLWPSLFAAGALSGSRPRGRRADVDREIRCADELYRKWLRRAAIAFVGAYFLSAVR